MSKLSNRNAAPKELARIRGIIADAKAAGERERKAVFRPAEQS